MSTKKQDLTAQIFQLQNVIEELPGDIYWKDKDSVWSGLNKTCVESLKRMGFIQNAKEILGKTDYQIFGRKTAALYRKHDLEVMEKKREISVEEVTQLQDGKTVVLLSTKRPLLDKTGEVAGIVGNTIDISHLKKIEEELQAAKNKAESASHAKTEFLENMRHDIRTPLSGIVGFSDLIQSKAKTPEITEYAENLTASAHALLDLMDEVLEAVRVSSGQIPNIKKKFSLEKILQHVIDLNKAKAESKGIQLSFELDKKIPKYLIGDNTRIHRITLELIANALNFTDAGFVKLQVKVGKKSGKKLILKIIVQDSGVGIPPDKQQDIFIQFKRLTPSYQGIYKGAGLGLSVIKQFIEDIEGEIYVESTQQKGSLFTCVIPLQIPLLEDETGVDHAFDLSPQAKPNTPTKPSTEKHRSENTIYKVLLVEDNVIAQKVAQGLLSGLCCSVDVAANGEEAVCLCTQKPYDLIFMDIGLPDIDGYETAKRIRKKLDKIPIIALTAHAGEEAQEKCTASGMNAMLSKPLTEKNCTETLDKFLKSSKPVQSSYASDLPRSDTELFELSGFPILDIQEGLNASGTEEMLTELLQMMIETSLVEDLAEMQGAYADNNWDKVQQLAHKIKGGAVYVGAIRMKMACQYLERYWKTGGRDLLEKLYQQSLVVIEDTVKEAKAWLEG